MCPLLSDLPSSCLFLPAVQVHRQCHLPFCNPLFLDSVFPRLTSIIFPGLHFTAAFKPHMVCFPSLSQQGGGHGQRRGICELSPVRRQLRMRPSLLHGPPSVCPQVHLEPPLISICPIWTTLGEMKGGALAGGSTGMGSSSLHLSLIPTDPPYIPVLTCFSEILP